MGLSDTSVPLRFWVECNRSRDVETNVARLIEKNVEPVISRIVDVTRTSERIHWSNASFALHRVYTHLLKMPNGLSCGEATRVASFGEMMKLDHPVFRLTRTICDPSGDHCVVRKVCCIRYRMDGIKNCGVACPIGGQLCSKH